MKRLGVIAITIFIGAFTSNAQTTAFSYQGTLAEGGVPANGSYEMQFKLFDSLGGPTQIGSTVTRSPVLVTNGAFAVVLDFGSSAFPGSDRFLEIAVRNLGGGGLTPLSPRGQLLSTPHAIRSRTVTGPVTGTSPTATLTVTNDQPGTQNPSPANLPPAALRAETTSTINATVGLIGISSSPDGAGIAGIANGGGTGIVGISTSTTGQTEGLSGEVLSPDGTVLDLFMPTGGTGHLINASSGTEGSSSTVFQVTSTGNTEISGSLSVFGTIFLPNPVGSGTTQLCRDNQSRLANCSSSLRYKTDVMPFLGGLDLLRRLRPITFNWKDGGAPDLGLGAENVEKIEPLLVTYNKDGQVEGVKYDRVGVVLINAVKEQQTQIDAQQLIIEQQRAELAALKTLVCTQNAAAEICRPKK